MEIFEGLKPLSSKLISSSHTVYVSLALWGFFVYQDYFITNKQYTFIFTTPTFLFFQVLYRNREANRAS